MAFFEQIARDILEWKLAILALSTLFLAYLICKFLCLDAFMSPLRNLPGPPRSLFFGNLPEIQRKGILNATMEWSKKYGGMFVLWLRPDQVTVYLTDLDLVKQVLVTSCYKYNRPEGFRDLIPPLGNSLMTCNGKEHTWQRKMLNPAFSYGHLKGMVPFMKTAADELVQLWKGNLEESQEDYADVMVHVDLNRLALDIIGESAFGYQFKSVLGVETEITKAFNHLTTGIRLGSFSMALPFYKYLPTKENRLKWNAIKITNEVVMKVIKGRRQLKKTSNTSRNRDLLDMAMDMPDDQTGLTMDDEQLCAQVFAFLFAGQESTSVTMAWTLYELAKYPDMQEKIREEANEVLGDGSVVTWAKLDELHYLGNVIKESMRLYPAAADVFREAALEDSLGGYRIPPKTFILCGIHAIQRSEKYWPDPETFKPERFEHLTKEQESTMRSILMPFSFGPRMCIGNKLATAEMRLVLASLLQNFTFSPVPGFPEVTPKIQLTTKPHPSLKLRIRPAS